MKKEVIELTSYKTDCVYMIVDMDGYPVSMTVTPYQNKLAVFSDENTANITLTKLVVESIKRNYYRRVKSGYNKEDYLPTLSKYRIIKIHVK